MVLKRQDDGKAIWMKVEIHFDDFDNVGKSNLCRHCMAAIESWPES